MIKGMPDESALLTNGHASPEPSVAPASAPLSSPATSAPADALAGVLDHHRSLGYELPDGVDGKTLLSHLYDNYGKVDEQTAQAARYGQEYVQFRQSPEWRAYEEWKKSQQPKEPEKPKGFQWPAVKYKPSPHAIRDPKTGRFVANPESPFGEASAAVAEGNAYLESRQGLADRLVDDLPSILDEYWQSKFDPYQQSGWERWKANHERYLAEARSQQFVEQNQILDQHGNVVQAPQGALFEHHRQNAWQQVGRSAAMYGNPLFDAAGNQLREPTDGEQLMVRELITQRTESDLNTAREWYGHLARQQEAQAAAAAAPVPEPTPEERNEANKANSVATARRLRKENPTSTPSRNVAQAVASPVPNGRIKGIRARIEEHAVLNP